MRACEMDAEMATPGCKARFDPNPERTQFRWIGWSEWFNLSNAVGAGGQWSEAPGLVTIGILSMGSPAHRVEMHHGLLIDVQAE